MRDSLERLNSHAWGSPERAIRLAAIAPPEQDAKKRGEAWSGPDYLASVVPPVLNALVDADARVRYYACEALYNIAKVLPCLHLVPVCVCERNGRGAMA